MEIRSSTKTINFDNWLKVGVLSDSQLSPWNNKKRNTYQKNLYRSLVTLKKLGCNMILFAGDICNLGSKFGYRRYKRCFKKAFGDDMPLLLSVMGNHDYYFCPFARRVFEKELKQPPYVHYVVNGFHFIGLSPDCKDMFNAYSKVSDWLDQQLDIATKDNPDAPVFVITHHPPHNTVYGSENWGDLHLDEVFSKYKNVVDFAGHSHFSLLDERSYYQGKYRVINTQSVSYIELEEGKTNGSVPNQAHIAPIGVVLDFAKDKINMLRYNLLDGKEQKKHMRWSIPYNVNEGQDRAIQADSMDKADATANVDNTVRVDKPVITDKVGEYHIDRYGTYLEFSRPYDKDFVHSYKVEYSDGDVQYYFSDFYKGIDKMSQPQKLKIYNKKRGLYNIKVYAVNSYGFVSDDYIEIDDVEISRYRKYRRRLAPDINY